MTPPSNDGLPEMPGALRRLIERQLTRLEPWWVFDELRARERKEGLAARYPGTSLVPFARREDNDDVACFDLDNPGIVVVLHDFAKDAWDRRRVYDDFYAWLRQAVEDMIEFDRLEE
jgi:hypothetical protein